MTIPLFKSHYSIGKSILTLKPSKNEEAADSVFDLAQEASLKEVFLVEDSLVGFLEALKISKDLDMNLRFGLRLSCVDDLSEESSACEHKVVIFSKNKRGCELLNQIYSFAFTEGNKKIDIKNLARLWDDDALKLVIPFYDSFIYKNLLSFSVCVPDFYFTKPTFFVEDNHLPFDQLIFDAVISYCKAQKLECYQAKSIYYKNRSDFEAFQTYKCVCNRGSFRKSSLECPNIDHCGSPEFSFESWKECK